METKNYLSLREVQLTEFHLLCQVADFFDSHDIKYFLCGGTLIGAIRHNGFIPWDDDIDIFVPRDDYEKLKDLVRKGENLEGDLTFRLPGDKDYQFPFVKAVNLVYKFDDVNSYEAHFQQYLWVDVFPLNHYPDRKLEHYFYVSKLRFFSKVTQYSALEQKRTLSRNSFLIFSAKLITFCFGGYRNVCVVADKLGKRLDGRYKDSNHVGNGSWTGDYYPAVTVADLSTHIFEGRMFCVPTMYDQFLRAFYGDYMQLPPANKRQTHCIKVYRDR